RQAPFKILEEDMEFVLAISNNLEELANAITNTKMSAHKLIRYLLSQTPFAHSERDYLRNFKGTASCYFDYIDTAKELGLSLSSKRISMPEVLSEAHDEAFEALTDKNDPELKEKYKRLYNDELCYIDEIVIDHLIFTIPRSQGDFIRRGNILKQCINRGSYFSKSARGQKIMVFINKAKEKDNPYLTLDIVKGSNIQCLGYDNKEHPTAEDTIAIEKYLKFVRNNINFTNGIQYVGKKQFTHKVA
ncbi:MAG: PcfJ domain-containing protein, partial [Ruminococcus sp.]|nr:PcfJ domain-containing protein [Ruminococcus sp.]